VLALPQGPPVAKEQYPVSTAGGTPYQIVLRELVRLRPSSAGKPYGRSLLTVLPSFAKMMKKSLDTKLSCDIIGAL